MNPIEALKFIRTLLNAIADSDDLDVVQKHLAMAQEIIKKALPRKNPGRHRSWATIVTN